MGLIIGHGVMNIIEFSTSVHRDIICKKKRICDESVWVAEFNDPDYSVKSQCNDSCSEYPSGKGYTIISALNDLTKEISGKWIVFDVRSRDVLSHSVVDKWEKDYEYFLSNERETFNVPFFRDVTEADLK
jgi:hypothetical protein